jgi:hypothetical protein
MRDTSIRCECCNISALEYTANVESPEYSGVCKDVDFTWIEEENLYVGFYCPRCYDFIFKP